MHKATGLILFLFLAFHRLIFADESILRLSPLALLQGFSDIKRQKPTINIIAPQEDYFDSVKTLGFKRVDQNDYNNISTVARFPSFNNRLGANINTKVFKSEQSLHKDLIFSKQHADLIIVNDLFPIRPIDFRLFEENLSRLAFLTDVREFSELNEKSAIRSLHQTDPIQTHFSKNSAFAYPLGYSDFTGALAISIEAFPIYYNSLARQTWEFFRDLSRDPENTEDPLYLEDLNFQQFTTYLKREGLVFYYPNPKAKETKLSGMVFMCQLLYWLDPKEYFELLENNNSANIKKAASKITSFLKANSNTFKPIDSLSKLLDIATKQNILANLPKNFNPDNPAFDFELPKDYKLNEQAHRLSFAFLPESYLIKPYSMAAFEVRNKVILDEKEKQRKADALAKIEREKARKSRLTKSKRRGAASNDLEGEESDTGDVEEEQELESSDNSDELEDEGDLTSVWKTHAAQLTSFNIDKIATIRDYALIQKDAQNLKNSLFFLNFLLFIDIQRAIASTPNYRRSIRDDIYGKYEDIEVYIPRLTSVDDKITKKDNQFFGLQFLKKQKQITDNFLPLLNPFYIKALEVLLWHK